MREIASCGDSTLQLSAEVKALSVTERQDLLQQAQLPITVPASDALAMKADLALPWNNNDKYIYLTHQINFRRWFKTFHVSIASEKRQRKVAKELVGDNLVAERGAFIFEEQGKEVVREVPFVYRPNLIAAIAEIVDKHERYTQHIVNVSVVGKLTELLDNVYSFTITAII